MVIAFILPVPCILGTAGAKRLLGGTGYAEKILAAANYPSEEKDAFVKAYERLSFPGKYKLIINLSVLPVVQEIHELI